jgi:hypothetical protein
VITVNGLLSGRCVLDDGGFSMSAGIAEALIAPLLVNDEILRL